MNIDPKLETISNKLIVDKGTLDSQNLIQELEKITFNRDSALYSCDFESLYTNIDLVLALQIITDFMKDKLDTNHLNIQGFNEILKIVLPWGPSVDQLLLMKLFIDDIFLVVKKDFNIDQLKEFFKPLKLNICGGNEIDYLLELEEYSFDLSAFKKRIYIFKITSCIGKLDRNKLIEYKEKNDFLCNDSLIIRTPFNHFYLPILSNNNCEKMALLNKLRNKISLKQRSGESRASCFYLIRKLGKIITTNTKSTMFDCSLFLSMKKSILSDMESENEKLFGNRICRIIEDRIYEVLIEKTLNISVSQRYFRPQGSFLRLPKPIEFKKKMSNLTFKSTVPRFKRWYNGPIKVCEQFFMFTFTSPICTAMNFSSN
ncbi:hypothetical protein BpHYR1_033801 [Brachionus plicatilis]|uniref:Uncharacterized protein n=1 Tax=Brachionus plicatilis TaxID=10195 RepID=A0A3M7R667_BRAPC|nr:hypothetical protein BpHYR1_033801 [Brachionus plicatilis]